MLLPSSGAASFHLLFFPRSLRCLETEFLRGYGLPASGAAGTGGRSADSLAPRARLPSAGPRLGNTHVLPEREAQEGLPQHPQFSASRFGENWACLARCRGPRPLHPQGPPEPASLAHGGRPCGVGRPTQWAFVPPRPGCWPRALVTPPPCPPLRCRPSLVGSTLARGPLAHILHPAGRSPRRWADRWAIVSFIAGPFVVASLPTVRGQASGSVPRPRPAQRLLSDKSACAASINHRQPRQAVLGHPRSGLGRAPLSGPCRPCPARLHRHRPAHSWPGFGSGWPLPGVCPQQGPPVRGVRVPPPTALPVRPGRPSRPASFAR